MVFAESKEVHEDSFVSSGSSVSWEDGSDRSTPSREISEEKVRRLDKGQSGLIIQNDDLLGFEGPEKMLEVDFVPGLGVPGGLRSIDRVVWEEVLQLARCRILSTMSNEYFDAYVLSESSLFVSEYKMFLKTCGTTTLLRCLPMILTETGKCGMVLEWLGYSRKNFIFPSDQSFPHCSFAQEIEYTKRCVGPLGDRLKGGAYMLGDVCKDHFYLYVADYCARDCSNAVDRALTIMMYDLDPQVQKSFYKKPGSSPTEDAVRAREELGIDKLFPKAIIDDYMFDPCGYSLNGLLNDGYFTIHVTPENDFSYASFETNIRHKSYQNLVANVLRIFRPGRFTMALFADVAALKVMDRSPVYWNSVGHYKRVSTSSTCFQTDYLCQMANFEYDPPENIDSASDDEPFLCVESMFANIS